MRRDLTSCAKITTRLETGYEYHAARAVVAHSES
jgi:hypothetical protein